MLDVEFQEFKKKLIRKDNESWSEAFDLLFPVARNAASSPRYALSPTDAEDIAMITMAQLVDKIEKVNTLQELKTLTSSIAHCRAKDYLRNILANKRGKNKTDSIQKLQDDVESFDVPDSLPEGLSELDLAELAIGLKNALASVSDKQNQILRSFALEGMSHIEIAEKFDIPKGSVGVNINRALVGIRKDLEKNPDLMKYMTTFLRCIPLMTLIQIYGDYIYG
jgi:RNA polymerase sigma factor (sigma-70 family)